MNTKQKSRELRRLAEDVLARLDIFVAERADLATSLVRQWITYEGKATLFLDERQIYFLLTRTPLGRTTAHIEEVQSTFIDTSPITSNASSISSRRPPDAECRSW